MKLRGFVDTNILLSGIFFEGNEAKILDLVEIELLTCEDVENLWGQTPKLTFHKMIKHTP